MFRFFIILSLIVLPVLAFSQDLVANYVPEGILNIRSFDVNKNGDKLAVVIYPSPEISVFDLLTGKELMRLSSSSQSPEKVYYDKGNNLIIGQFSDSIHIWDADNYHRTLSFANPGSLASDFNEATQRMAFMSRSYIHIYNVKSGLLENSLFSASKNSGYLYGDRIKFSPDGNVLFEMASGQILGRSLNGAPKITEIPGKELLNFTVTNNLVVTLKDSRKTQGSRVWLQFFSIEGTHLKDVYPTGVYQLAGSVMKPFNDGSIFYSSYNAVDLIDARGNEYKFKLPENVVDYQFVPGKGFVVNYGKRIELLDTEGRLLSRVFAKSSYHSRGHLDDNGKHFLMLAENQYFHQEISEELNNIPREIGGSLVNGLAHDGKIVAHGTREGEFLIWDVESGQVIKRINYKGEYRSFLAISEELSLLIAASRHGNSVEVYDYRSAKLQEKFSLPGGYPTSIDFDGNWLAVGTSTGSLYSWELNRGTWTPHKSDFTIFNTPLTSIEISGEKAFLGSIGRIVEAGLENSGEISDEVLISHDSYITAMSLDRQNRFLTSCSMEGDLQLWDVNKGHLLESLNLDSAWIDQLSLYDSMVIVGNGPGLVTSTVYNPALFAQITSPSPELLIQTSNTSEVRKTVFSPDGKLLANTDGDKIRVREVQTGFMLTEINSVSGVVNDIEFDNNGSTLIVAAGKGLEYYDPFTGKLRKAVSLEFQNRSIHEIEVFPKRNIVYAINRHGWHFPVILHQNSGQSFGTFNLNPGEEIDKSIINLKVSPAEKYLATYGQSYIKIFQPDENFIFRQVKAIPRKNPEIHNEYWVDIMSFSPDERYLSYIEFGDPNTVVIYDLLEDTIISEEPGKLQLFTGKNSVLRMTSNTLLSTFDISKVESRILRSDNFHNSLIQSLAYDPNQNIAASSDIWGNLKLWDLEEGKTFSEIDRFTNDIYHSEISSNGKYIAFNNKQGIFLFDLTELRTIDLEGTNYPYFGAFSSDNRHYYFRKENEIWRYDLQDHIREKVLSGTIEKEDAGNIILSEDGSMFLMLDNNTDEYLVYTASGELKYTVPKAGIGEYLSFTVKNIDAERKTLIGVGISKESDTSLGMTLVEYNFESGKLKELSRKRYQSIEDMEGWDKLSLRYNTRLNEVNQQLLEYAYLEDYHLKIEDLSTSEIMADQWTNDIRSGAYSNDGQFLVLGFVDGKVKVLSKGQEIYNFIGMEGDISNFQINGRFLLILGSNDKINVFDTENEFRKIYTCSFMGEGEFVIANEEGYYYASRGAIGSIAFKKGAQVFPFEQFDLIYNRPDRAVKNLVDLNITDQSLAEAFERAYLKRLKKTGFNPEDISNTFHLPEVSWEISQLTPTTEGSKIVIPVSALDSLYTLNRLHLWINDVPVYGSGGRIIDSGKSYNTEIEIPLTPGQNKVQVSVTNEKGSESLKKTFRIESTHSFGKSDLYLVSIGASKYGNENFNLTYAAKDAKDLADFTISELSGDYNEIHSTILLNHEVTTDRIKSLKSDLLKSNPQDVVILFYAGHGLLDQNLDYYFATYGTDFTDPSKGSLPYEELEGLLDGIPARKKLLLIDACHSGEIDKEEVVQTTEEIDVGSLQFRGFKGFENKKGELGLKNSFELMQMLFADLRRGTGAMVISSAGGVEVALEGTIWKNGVFTYSLLEGLKTRNCDLNNDGEIRVSELREYVISKVEALTDGKQNPTSRKENLEFDFSVW